MEKKGNICFGSHNSVGKYLIFLGEAGTGVCCFEACAPNNTFLLLLRKSAHIRVIQGKTNQYDTNEMHMLTNLCFAECQHFIWRLG